MPDFGIFRGFNDKLFGDKLYAGQLPTQLGLIGSQEVFDIDPDAAAFFDRVAAATGVLSATEKTAIDNLVRQMKADGIWTKMKAIYPMVGASAAACAQNLKSSSFTGTFNGGWTFASTGATPNGTNGYMDTFLNDSTELSLNSGSFGVYLNTFVGEKIPVLISDGLGGFVGTWVIERMVAQNVDTAVHSGFLNAGAPNQSAGFYQLSRINSTQLFFRTNNVLQTRSQNSTSLVNTTYILGAWSDNGVKSEWMRKEARFFYIGDGLTTTEQSNFYTAVQAFQTTLARQV